MDHQHQMIEHPYGQYYPVQGGYYNNPYYTGGSTTLTNTYTMNPVWVQSPPLYATPPPVTPVNESPLEWLDRRVSEITDLLAVVA